LAWSVKFHPAAEKELAALDKPIQRRIQRFIGDRLLKAADPGKLGQALTLLLVFCVSAAHAASGRAIHCPQAKAIND